MCIILNVGGGILLTQNFYYLFLSKKREWKNNCIKCTYIATWCMYIHTYAYTYVCSVVLLRMCALLYYYIRMIYWTWEGYPVDYSQNFTIYVSLPVEKGPKKHHMYVRSYVNNIHVRIYIHVYIMCSVVLGEHYILNVGGASCWLFTQFFITYPFLHEKGKKKKQFIKCTYMYMYVCM